MSDHANRRTFLKTAAAVGIGSTVMTSQATGASGAGIDIQEGWQLLGTFEEPVTRNTFESAGLAIEELDRGTFIVLDVEENNLVYKDEVEAGKGYWAKITEGGNIEPSPIPSSYSTQFVGSGGDQNIVSVSKPTSVDDLNPNIRLDPWDNYDNKFLTYTDADGYISESTMQPGRGYFVRVNSGGIYYPTSTSTGPSSDSLQDAYEVSAKEIATDNRERVVEIEINGRPQAKDDYKRVGPLEINTGEGDRIARAIPIPYESDENIKLAVNVAELALTVATAGTSNAAVETVDTGYSVAKSIAELNKDNPEGGVDGMRVRGGSGPIQGLIGGDFFGSRVRYLLVVESIDGSVGGLSAGYDYVPEDSPTGLDGTVKFRPLLLNEEIVSQSSSVTTSSIAENAADEEKTTTLTQSDKEKLPPVPSSQTVTPIVEQYDQNDDGDVSVEELGEAGQDFAADELTIEELAEIGQEFAND
jgi:hypothetical protein